MTTLNKLLQDRYGIDLSTNFDVSQTFNTILGHQVCRKYKKDRIPRELITALLGCAQSAPTKSNLQQYSIILVDDLKLKLEIASLAPKMGWLNDAPVIFIFLGDVRRIRRLAAFKGYDYKNNNTDTFMNAVVDAALAMQSLIIGAESMKLGSCPISYLRNEIVALSELLKLPEGVFPICGLTIGYKDAEGKVSMRLPQEIVVHTNQYDDSGLESKIAKYDARESERNPISPDKQRHTDKYGVLKKCTWSENVVRQLSISERDGFFEYLKSKNINLI